MIKATTSDGIKVTWDESSDVATVGGHVIGGFAAFTSPEARAIDDAVYFAAAARQSLRWSVRHTGSFGPVPANLRSILSDKTGGMCASGCGAESYKAGLCSSCWVNDTFPSVVEGCIQVVRHVLQRRWSA